MQRPQASSISRNISLRGGQSQASSPLLTPRSRSPPRRGMEPAEHGGAKKFSSNADSARFAPRRDVSNVEILAKLVAAGRGNISVTNFTVSARLSDTISSMKHEVERITGLPPHHQRVISRGRVLSDQDRLGDHPALHHKHNPLHIIPIKRGTWEPPEVKDCDARATRSAPDASTPAATSAGAATRVAAPSAPSAPASLVTAAAALASAACAPKSLEDTLREAEVLLGGRQGVGAAAAGAGRAGGGAGELRDASDDSDDSYFDRQAQWLTSGTLVRAPAVTRGATLARATVGRARACSAVSPTPFASVASRLVSSRVFSFLPFSPFSVPLSPFSSCCVCHLYPSPALCEQSEDMHRLGAKPCCCLPCPRPPLPCSHHVVNGRQPANVSPSEYKSRRHSMQARQRVPRAAAPPRRRAAAPPRRRLLLA
jgi:hypothetical protein